ncbi:unnamed protein product [Mytilus edulis]|uniref:Uncharacterized protein n=1 Tax=Mytilus edulis TaxID=6550 RepID=A0A8S3PN20_MYTED|nr:unnamed protein product [Mytilus edulis]
MNANEHNKYYLCQLVQTKTVPCKIFTGVAYFTCDQCKEANRARKERVRVNTLAILSTLVKEIILLMEFHLEKLKQQISSKQEKKHLIQGNFIVFECIIGAKNGLEEAQKIVSEIYSGRVKRGLLQLLSEDLVPSFDSRILVVGAYKAGKTTLVSNLIGKAIPRERQSTDGIDVYFGKLLFDLKKQQLLKKTKGVHSFPKAIYQKISSYLKSVKRENVIPGNTQPDIPNDDVLQKLSAKIDDCKDENFTDWFGDQEVIPIPVLDFAGQIVYLATHQTFITSHGIYIIAFNGSRNLDDLLSDRGDERMTTILENIQQWVSSILLYSHPDNKDYPRLLFVATHRDLVCQEDIPTKRSQLLTRLSACFTNESVKSHLMLQKRVLC